MERDPLQGKEVPGDPEKGPRLPSQAFLQARASQEPQGRRGTYKVVHIWPDGAAFPRKTWPKNPGTQLPPFTDRRRKRIQSGADLRGGGLCRSQPFLFTASGKTGPLLLGAPVTQAHL